jgi:caa(3)-type oxidase subunit IV
VIAVSEQKPTVFEHDHPAPVAAGGAVAVVQAIVLGVFFMDLKHADKQTWLIAAAGIFWTFLLFLFTLTDYLTRHYYAF